MTREKFINKWADKYSELATKNFIIDLDELIKNILKGNYYNGDKSKMSLLEIANFHYCTRMAACLQVSIEDSFEYAEKLMQFSHIKGALPETPSTK